MTASSGLPFYTVVLYITASFTVREDLVYDAQTDDLIGFTNMGSQSNNKVDDLATHALTVYAKSFCGTPGLKFPLAYFATVTAKAPQLASIVWEKHRTIGS